MIRPEDRAKISGKALKKGPLSPYLTIYLT